MKFNFVKLELRVINLPFRFGFRHAAATRNSNQSLFLTLYTNAGAIGYGECIAREYVTGESLESTWQDLSARLWPAIKAIEFDSDELPLRELQPLFNAASEQRRTAAFAGMDLAVFDAWAKIKGTNLAKIWNPAMLPAPLTATIPIMRPERMAFLARMLKLSGYQSLKVKVSRPSDLMIALRIREVIGPDMRLSFDGNGGLSLAEAKEFCAGLLDVGAEAFEQPVRSWQDLVELSNYTHLPILADESLCSVADADLLANSDVGWNMRLAKNGGFTGFRTLLARAGKRPIMLGAMVGETNLLTAAQQCCLGMAPFIQIDFGFSRILLKADPFIGDLSGYRGKVTAISTEPGIGVRCRDDFRFSSIAREQSYT